MNVSAFAAEQLCEHMRRARNVLVAHAFGNIDKTVAQDARTRYDDQKRAPQLGLGSLRMARRLRPGHVVTDEPGIYFVPALIAKWKAEGTDKGMVNYSEVEKYLDFGGIRLEDDLLITEDGCRRLGPHRLPIKAEDVEASMA